MSIPVVTLMCDFDNVNINTNTNIHIDNINIQMLTWDIIIGYHAYNLLTCISIQYQKIIIKCELLESYRKR